MNNRKKMLQKEINRVYEYDLLRKEKNKIERVPVACCDSRERIQILKSIEQMSKLRIF